MFSPRKLRLVNSIVAHGRVAMLTRDEIYDILSRSTQFSKGMGLPPQEALQKAVQEYETKRGRRIPQQDVERLQRNLGAFGNFESNPEVRQVARDFNKSRGLPDLVPHEHVKINPEEAAEYAREYEKLPTKMDPSDPRYQEMKKSYAVLRMWIRRQYKAITSAGVNIQNWPYPTEPYKDSAAMRADVRDNKHLWVFTGGTQTGSHPFFAPEENIMFRAVHDYLAHAAEGYSFGPQGEYNAWTTHAQTLPEDAKPALAMETVLQNMWTNYGPHILENPARYERLDSRPFVDEAPVVAPKTIPQPKIKPLPLKP